MVQSIKDYILLRKISCGNIGRVWLCINSNSFKHFAIKICDLSKKEHYSIFENECKILTLCNHNNIVKIHEHGILKTTQQYHVKYFSKNIGFIVTDLLDFSIKDYLLHNTIDEKQTLLWSRDIILALQYLYKNNIVHRDLSPANIMIKKNKAYLIDFGFATPIYSQNISCNNQIRGTLNHIAPEQILNFNKPSILNDIYSLGSIIYYMLTKKYIHNNISNTKHYISHKKYSLPEQLYNNKNMLSDDMYNLIISMVKPIKYRIQLNELKTKVELMLNYRYYKSYIS